MKKKNFNLIELLNLIKYPSLTEKSISLYGNRQYTFIVDRNLTKTQIKFILQKLFDVTILKVNTCLLPVKIRRVGKFTGKCSVYKKAYIQLQKGQTISNLFN